MNERIRRARRDAGLMARAVRITVGAFPAAAFGVFAVATGAAVGSVASVWVSKVVVDRLARGADAMVPAIVYAASLVAVAAADPIGRLLTAEIEERTCGEVDRRIMAAGTALVDLHRIERPAFLDEMEVLRHAVHYVPRSILLLERLVRAPLTLAGILGLLVRLNPLLPVLLGVVTVAHIRAEQQMGFRRHEAMVRRSRAAREMDYCVRTVTEPASAKEVRAFGLGEFFLRRHQERADAALREMRDARLAGAQATLVLAALHALVVAAGFVYVARRAGAGGLSPGDVALFLNVVVQATAVSWGLAFVFVYGHETLLNLRVLLPFLDDARPAIALPPPGAGRCVSTPLEVGVELARVRFRYPESDQAVLDELSALVPARKVTAVVGANGAGKSTLVKLLGRMYDPEAGTIAVDGVVLPELDLGWWRAQIAAVHQDFARFALSVRDNVAVGGLDAEPQRVDEAVRWAGVDVLAGRLPEGLDTLLTRQFPGGVELSGGEWQKVALARGAVRDAALVILDEPTSGLDPDAEYQLFERFRQLVSGRTAILISHRFSTVRMADHIVVIENGRVLEAGSHEELVSAGGRYAQLYEMQASRYR